MAVTSVLMASRSVQEEWEPPTPRFSRPSLGRPCPRRASPAGPCPQRGAGRLAQHRREQAAAHEHQLGWQLARRAAPPPPPVARSLPASGFPGRRRGRGAWPGFRAGRAAALSGPFLLWAHSQVPGRLRSAGLTHPRPARHPLQRPLGHHSPRVLRPCPVPSHSPGLPHQLQKSPPPRVPPCVERPAPPSHPACSVDLLACSYSFNRGPSASPSPAKGHTAPRHPKCTHLAGSSRRPLIAVPPAAPWPGPGARTASSPWNQAPLASGTPDGRLGQPNSALGGDLSSSSPGPKGPSHGWPPPERSPE